MLVLTRKVGEYLLLGDQIKLCVVRIDGDEVRIGINAPRSIAILRGELVEANRTETAAAPVKLQASDVQNLSRRLKRKYTPPTKSIEAKGIEISPTPMTTKGPDMTVTPPGKTNP